MATLELSQQDIDYIGRVVATEVPSGLRLTNPREYQRMVGAVVDTIANRVTTNRYGTGVAGVANKHRAFSKITGPARLNPYGSIQNTPAAPKSVQNAVNAHLAARKQGVPSEVPGALDYANPFHSDDVNLRGWVNPMIAAGALKLGQGQSVHYHGLAPGNEPAGEFGVRTPDGFMPEIEPGMRRQVGIPTPTQRPSLSPEAEQRALAGRQMADAGILGLDGRQSGRYAAPVEKVTRGPALQAALDRMQGTPTGYGHKQAAASMTRAGVLGLDGRQSTSLAAPVEKVTRGPLGPIASQVVSRTPALDKALSAAGIRSRSPAQADTKMAVEKAARQQYATTRAAAPLSPVRNDATPMQAQNIPGFQATIAPPSPSIAPSRTPSLDAALKSKGLSPIRDSPPARLDVSKTVVRPDGSVMPGLNPLGPIQSAPKVSMVRSQIVDPLKDTSLKQMSLRPAPLAPIRPLNVPMVPSVPLAPIRQRPIQPVRPPSVPLAPVPQQFTPISPVQDTTQGITPGLRPGDIYGGATGSALSTGGNVVSRANSWGPSTVTNRYGVTTATMPDGKQAAYNPGFGMDFSSLGGTAKKTVGSIAGGVLGSLIGGPAGGLVGGLLGRTAATPGGGMLGSLFGGSSKSSGGSKASGGSSSSSGGSKSASRTGPNRERSGGL